MKPYALKNYSERALKHNIQDIGVNVWTDILNIKEEYRDDFSMEYAVEEDDSMLVNIWLTDVEEMCIDSSEIEYCMGSDFDKYVFKDFIEYIIKPFKHYLVCAYNSNWLKQTGYKIADSIEDAFYRDYNVSQYYRGGSSGGKSICITEYHHDVPMGHSTMIIGLTNKEYEKLSYWDCDFETVIKFADEKSKSIIEI